MVKDMAVSIMKCLDEGVKKIIGESEDTLGDTEEVSPSQGTFRVWGFRFGVWGSGFGVWGLGFDKTDKSPEDGGAAKIPNLKSQTPHIQPRTRTLQRELNPSTLNP